MYEKFYDVRNELESKGERFNEESLRRISYGNLMLAFVGNAGKATCKNWDLLKKEQQRRINQVKHISLDDLVKDKGIWEILDDSHMLYAVMESKVGEPYTSEVAPKWILLVHYMQKLRGDWSDKRDSYYLEMIYELIPQAIEEGIVPEGWLRAVKNNADAFDGHYNDGRIMRDGDRGGLSGNLAGALGFNPLEQDGGFCGGYEELFEKILTPEQMIQYQTPIEDLEEL